MSKAPPVKGPAVDLSTCCKSTFTLTFAVEVLGIEVWHDCNEGWLDLGPCTQGIKIQYQLYPGQTFDIDILIWPHTAKIWCGMQYGWVRTWQYLERRWLTFSIRHAFPVRVVDLRIQTATVTPTFGMAAISANAKNDKNFEVYLPKLKFGERRYFGPVAEAEDSLEKFIQDLIWNAVIEYIPASYLDGPFDIPYAVTDVRHQDSVLYYVQETILNRSIPEEVEEPPPEPEEPKLKDRRESKMPKEKEKKKVEVPKIKFEIKLSGDAILAGVGRIVLFETFGDRPADLGEILVLISSNNLPADDDLPIIFVNVENLCDIPVEEFKKLRISQLYTQWTLGEEKHDSQPQILKNKKEIQFNDHHVLPLEYSTASEITATFLDDPFEIQFRGIRQPVLSTEKAKFFGYDRRDRDFGIAVPPKPINEDLDFKIAVTKIDARSLAKGSNGIVRGEYPLYPPSVSIVNLSREGICTNDINAVRAEVKPDLVVQPYIILQAQMTLEVSIGVAGCIPKKLVSSYARMFGLLEDGETIMEIIRCISEINENIIKAGETNDLLTGFALDTGATVMFYVEGPKDGQILKVWDMTEDFYPKVKPVFSSSATYSTRLYPELIYAAIPFTVLKMHVPLGVLLACPPIYTRPALPLPTRSAVLKIGRLISSKLLEAPCRYEMPTGSELKSFRLELCVAPRPSPIDKNFPVLPTDLEPRKMSQQSVGRINWNK